MKLLTRWLQRAARREARTPSLFGALLTGRARRYVTHRLRFMLPRTLLSVLLHAAEIYLLTLALPWEYFAPLLSFRATAALVGGSHWGALEALRRRVRDEQGGRRPERARKLIEAWLFVTSAVVAAASLVVAALVTRRLTGDGLTLFEAYGLACFLRLMLELLVSTYHSGIYAVRRVYRPMAAAILPDLLELAILVLLWRPLGAWGIALSIVLTAVLRAGLTFHYARRTYDKSRIGRPGLWRGRRALSLLSRTDLHAAALHSLGNAGSQLDALLLLVLTRADSTPEAGFTLGIVYGLRPLLSLAHGWPRAFYPDFKLVERGLQRVFIERLHQLLLRTAAWVAGCAASVILASGLLFSTPPPLSIWLLACICLLRARYAVELTEAFAFAQHARSLRLTLPVLLVLCLSGLLGLDQLATLALTLLSLSATVLVDAQRRLPHLAQREQGPVLGLPSFFARLEQSEQPLFCALLSVDRRVTSRAKLIRALLGKLPGLVLCRVGSSQLACSAAHVDAPTRAQLISAAGGALRALTVVASDTPGRQVAQALRRSAPLRELFALAPPHGDSQLPGLCEQFRRAFPDGQLLDFQRLQRVEGELTPPVQRALLRALLSASREGARSHVRGTYQVAVYAPGGAPAAAFIAPAGETGFALFSRQVLRASLAAR